ncbi:MAG: FGGY-family carbohydrate kinase [Candidatus Buchananbacteria bacterium]
MKKEEGHVIGVDDGTDGLAVVLLTTDGQRVATGDCKVPLTKGPKGERTQNPIDWRNAFRTALADARSNAAGFGIDFGPCLGICPTGQMHGKGQRGADGTFGNSVRLWCDAGSKPEADELTELFGHPVPQRLLISRWLEEIRHFPDRARECTFLTTPSGVIATFLDPQVRGLGFGDACGAFPVDPQTGKYYPEMVRQFDELTKGIGVRPLLELLAQPVMVGDIVGRVDQAAADYFDLLQGLPIFSPEGDQPTTLAGTFTGKTGVVGFSGGTSFCWNMIAGQAFIGRHPGVEPFMTCDGRRFFMCHIQNGTPPMNAIVEAHGGFDVVMPLAAQAPVNCSGLIMLPLMEPEHGLGLPTEAHAAMFNLRADNLTTGNMARAAFLGSMFSLLWSVEALRRQNIIAREFVVSGGIAKSEWTVQAIADVFDTPCRIMEDVSGSSDDDASRLAKVMKTQTSGFGAALMALYGHRKQGNSDLEWPDFLQDARPKNTRVFHPIRENVAACRSMYQAFCPIVERVASELNRIPWVA